MLTEFDLTIPESLDDALGALAEGAENGTAPLAGGTNVLVDNRARIAGPSRLVGLGRLAELRRIEAKEGRVCIGALTTISDVMGHFEMSRLAPSMVASARVFGGQMVRNAATVAGNVAYGSPAADMMPPLLSLDAEVTLRRASGTRAVPLDHLFTGFKESVRAADELITEIAWPVPPENSANLFYKLGLRKGDAISVVCLAVTITAEGGRCKAARIALGAVAPTVIRAREAEAMLIGETLTPALIDAAAKRAAEECSPIDDIRASSDYRRHVVHMLTRRLVGRAWDQLT
jgi:carbon-monoxide dehydrogenase medium subunit